MASLKRLSQRYVDTNLERSESRHNTAKAVHDELERLLAPPSEEHWPRRTFFDEPRLKPAAPPAPEEVKKEAEPADEKADEIAKEAKKDDENEAKD